MKYAVADKLNNRVDSEPLNIHPTIMQFTDPFQKSTILHLNTVYFLSNLKQEIPI